MMLCEALYPSLQILEIALRNTLDRVLTDKYGTTRWFEPPRSPLARWEQTAVEKAREAIEKRSKTVTPGRLVAELNFGFWTSLLDRRYEHGQILWPGLLKPAFGHMPRRIRTRRNLARRLNGARTLRNRVFHHERILHWEDLSLRHAEIMETVGWISPELQAIARVVDRYDQVRASGLAECCDRLDAL